MPMLAAGIYVNSVRRWLDTYGRENAHLVAAEDFFAGVPATVCGIHEFLGLPAIEPQLHAEVLVRNPPAGVPAGRGRVAGARARVLPPL
ncbi:hypothetical protein ACIRRA_00695 [Nocardia sp. NPDC101769]|uniref:hypothetical protein n=1 Tax=Nocardia sp. NPDC101769 TaxID=3364333 RepID=UPI0037F6B47C